MTKDINWNLAMPRLEQIAEIVEQQRRSHYRALKKMEINEIQSYKELTYNLFFEIKLYAWHRDKKWREYNENMTEKKIKQKFEEIDNKIMEKSNSRKELRNIINSIEEIDETVNKARLEMGLDIPKGYKPPTFGKSRD